MEKKKIYKVGKTYYSKNKGIFGLRIARPLFEKKGIKKGDSFFQYTLYSVVEDTTPDRNMWKRKSVYRGSLSDCRQYLRKRFNKEK